MIEWKISFADGLGGIWLQFRKEGGSIGLSIADSEDVYLSLTELFIDNTTSDCGYDGGRADNGMRNWNWYSPSPFHCLYKLTF